MDFTTNGEDCKEKIQVIIEKYTSLYKATGGFIQYEKTSYYCWNWQRKNGILWVNNKVIELKGNERLIAQRSVKEASRTLGMYIIPSMK
jgi:hypothetical protein